MPYFTCFCVLRMPYFTSFRVLRMPYFTYFTKTSGKPPFDQKEACLIREKVVTFRMVKLNMLLSIFLITK